MLNRWMTRVWKEFLAILRAHHEPHEVAFGAAVGCFISVLPLYGLHTVLCVAAAVVIPKANKLAILLGTNVSLPFTLPLITWAGYGLGCFLLRPANAVPLTWDYIRHIDFSKLGDIYFTLFVGSVVLGGICAVILYFLVLAVARYLNERRPHE